MLKWLGKTLLITIFSNLSFSPSGFSAEKSELTVRTPIDYQNLLDELVNSKHIPGAVLLVDTSNGRFIGSAGYSDKIKKIKMPINAVMPNGSAGKKLTALLVAMLHEEGKLDLDAPISAYLEKKMLKQIEHSEKMTLRKLLNHTSGIFEYNDAGEYDFYKAQFSQPDKATTDRFPLSFALGKPAEFEPDERFGYSNTGYTLTGIILENVLGEHPAKAIRNKILNPLGMTSSYLKGVEKPKPEMISGYFINTYESSFPTPLNVWIDTKDMAMF